MAYQENLERESNTDTIVDLDRARNDAITSALGPNVSSTTLSAFGGPSASGSSKDVTFIDEAIMSGAGGSVFGKALGVAYSAYEANAGTTPSYDLMSMGGKGGKRGRSNSLHIENSSATSSFGSPKALQKTSTPLVEPGYLEKRRAANPAAARKESMIMGVNNCSMSLTGHATKGAQVGKAAAGFGVTPKLINELNSISNAMKNPSASRLAKGLNRGDHEAEAYVDANPHNLNTKQAIKMSVGNSH